MSQFKPPNLFPQDTHSALIPMGDATSDDDSGSETFTDALEAQSVMTAISQDLPLGLGPPASQVLPQLSSLVSIAHRVLGMCSTSESLASPSPSQVNLAIPGLYLIFDLISENGTGGMVDKIIIAQDSLAAFVNDLCPGAYTSITKVDFKALDQNYHPPSCLLRLVSSNEQQAPSLRSGLYVARAPHTPQDVFVIYWPEDGTWSSQAQSYLAKLTEQLICLISSEDQASIVWSTGGDQTTNDDEDPDETDDRLFSFEVAKTREEEENVTVRPGFDIRCRSVMPPQLEASCFVAQGLQANRPNNARYERALLRDLLERGQLRISEDVDDLAIDFMIKSGLDKRCPAEIKQYKDDKAEIENTVHSQKVQELHTWTRTQEEEECRLRLVMKKEILRRIVALYPVVRDELTKQHPEIVFDEDDTTYQNMATSYPVLPFILGGRFALLKERVMIADHLLRAINFSGKQAERDHLIKSALRGDSLITSSQSKTSRSSSRFTLNFSLLWNSDIDRDDRHRTKVIEEAKHAANAKSDCEFFTELPIFGEREPLFKETIEKLQISLMEQLNNLVDKTPSSAARKLSRTQTDGAKKHLDLKYSQLLNNRLRDNRRTFFVAVEQKTDSDNGVLCVIDDLRPERVYYSSYSSACNVTGQIITKTQETMEFKIIPLKISSAHMQELSVNPSFIPHPEEVAFRLQTSFELTTKCRINFIQMVHDDRCLVIIDDGAKLFVYLDKLGSLGRTIKSRKSHRQLYKEKLGAQPLITFDESKHKQKLIIYLALQPALHLYVFSEDFSALTSWSGVISLHPWYSDGAKELQDFLLSFKAISSWFCFVVEYASISLCNLWLILLWTPRAYRFGPIWLSPANFLLISPPKSTEFQFLSKTLGGKTGTSRLLTTLSLTCFAETWRRFPVVPAIPRQTTLHGQPQARQICFVTEHDHSRYEPYFQEMHRGFELQTRKPTGDTISSIHIRALTMEMFTATFGTWLLSEQRAGEWLVDMFCLLPIHIAITQENRFVPLKDGVISRELEQSLLGADVGRVVD
ncbi:hypothetical protein DL96DRAFT_1706949 [Flagelloscypha sp. PMI_526]|nr:hypothetical protein DL96DRAFT_1706949 [Flagelloscypha sp. PMI_526]